MTTGVGRIMRGTLLYGNGFRGQQSWGRVLPSVVGMDGLRSEHSNTTTPYITSRIRK